MDAVTTMVPTVVAFFGSCFELITENPVLCFLLVCGLVPIGFDIFSSAKGAVK